MGKLALALMHVFFSILANASVKLWEKSYRLHSFLPPSGAFQHYLSDASGRGEFLLATSHFTTSLI